MILFLQKKCHLFACCFVTLLRSYGAAFHPSFVANHDSHIINRPLSSTLLFSNVNNEELQNGLLSSTLTELAGKLGGSGRANAVWDCIRQGIDPNIHYSIEYKDVSDEVILKSWLAASMGIVDEMEAFDDMRFPLVEDVPSSGRRVWIKLQNLMAQYESSHQSIERYSKRKGTDSHLTIENCIASISRLKVSSDGTTKFLLKMAKDNLEVESVIIPWKEKGFSTLCVSSQVGCRQGCTFCATGRMGILRSLTADEIIVQVFYAVKIRRIVQSLVNDVNKAHLLINQDVLPRIDNIVFMGMGEPADNVDAVIRAANALVDRKMFTFAQSKVTISTVAPDVSSFDKIGDAPALIAWSVHAVKDSLRQKLVPTTKDSMENLRRSLVETLSKRSRSMRRIMLEVVLIKGVNDSDKDAARLGKFAQSIVNDIEGAKVVVNLIPFNDIGHPSHETPSTARVLEFQKQVIKNGNAKSILCYIRSTRGDEESSACGQLATKRRPTAIT